MNDTRGGAGSAHHHPVMVVEDDPDIREVVQIALEEEGFEVVTAANGAEAEAELEQGERPRIMLLDLMMPVMNGWELLEHLRRDGWLRDGMRVVIMSATPTGALHGSAKTMQKPVSLDQLVDTVRSLC